MHRVHYPGHLYPFRDQQVAVPIRNRIHNLAGKLVARVRCLHADRLVDANRYSCPRRNRYPRSLPGLYRLPGPYRLSCLTRLSALRQLPGPWQLLRRRSRLSCQPLYRFLVQLIRKLLRRILLRHR